MTETAYWYFERFGEPTAVMRQGRQALPEPGPGQAVVALRAVGLNQAENRYLRGTHFPPERFPACLSHEAVGEIVALGPDIAGGRTARRWSVGDRVAFIPMLVDMPGMGVLRQVGLYDLSALAPVPDAFSDRQAAAYWMGIVTMAGAMEMAGLGPETAKGRMVAFTAAAGGMGIMALKLARAWGAEALATTRSPRKIEQLSGLADHVAIVEMPAELTGALRAWRPSGVDAVIDPLGGDFVGAAVDALVPGGRYVGYEMVAGPVGGYDIMALMTNDASIHGYTVFRPLRHPGMLRDLVDIGMRFADRLTPVLATDFAFDDAPQAFDALARSQHVGKITITL